MILQKNLQIFTLEKLKSENVLVFNQNGLINLWLLHNDY